MVNKTIICGSPEELDRAVADFLKDYDLYEIQHNVVNVNGNVQFIAYIYARKKPE